MMTQRAPLVVILGATACGKSRLAIEIAQKFCGEIISADSMQVYKGLNIVTNKVSEDEQNQAKHHVINFMDPMSRYSVVDFKNRSLEIIDDLHKQKQLPIVVGGTNYYIESLLWKAFTFDPTFKQPTKRSHETVDAQPDPQDLKQTLIDSETRFLDNSPNVDRHTEDDLDDIDKFFSKPIYNDAFAHIDSEKLWRILEQVDTEMAHKYHPHDKRRIIRILQIIQDNKCKKSYTSILDNLNRSTDDRAALGGPLRYDTCVIWLHCDNDTLDKMLDDRVDAMLNRGLLAELEDFHQGYNKRRLLEGKWPEYDKGIFQTIGFKEFHEYLMLDQEKKDSDEGNKILKKSIDQMKLSTRRYARRQLKWIRRRFLQGGTRDLPPLFKLNTAFDDAEWMKQVYEPAVSIVAKFLAGQSMSAEQLAFKLEPGEQEIKNEPGKLNCQVCDRILIGTICIDAHLKSRAHRRNLLKTESIAKKVKTSEETSEQVSETQESTLGAEHQNESSKVA